MHNSKLAPALLPADQIWPFVRLAEIHEETLQWEKELWRSAGEGEGLLGDISSGWKGRI